jgi:flagellin-like hook-associated protein FlgL
MSRISSAISGIERQLLTSLATANAEITLSALRISTGHKINSPKDNPSAFVTLTKNQSQLNVVTATLGNVTAADSMVSDTQTALDNVQSQMEIIRTELVKDVNHTLTDSERAESQAKINAALDAINSVAGTTINGKTVLGGGGDYSYAGVNTSQVSNVTVKSGNAAGNTISGSVTSTATRASLVYTGNSSNQTTAAATFTLSGDRGSAVISVTSGEALSDVATAINNKSYETGVTASVNSTDHTLTFTSVDYGSSAKTSVLVSSGTFAVTGGDGQGTSYGTNASAVINGKTISSTSSSVSGNTFSYGQNGLTFNIEFKAGFTGTFNTITVEGNNLSYALSTNIAQKASVTVTSSYSADYNGVSGSLDDLYSGGSLSGLGNNTAQAIRVIDESLAQLSDNQAAVDGFYNSSITKASDMLTSMQTDLQDYIDTIDKTDDTEETTKIAYYQTLADNAVSSLTILSQQRQSIVNMLQDIAGLKQT